MRGGLVIYPSLTQGRMLPGEVTSGCEHMLQTPDHFLLRLYVDLQHAGSSGKAAFSLPLCSLKASIPSLAFYFLGTNLPSALRELAGSGKPEVIDFIFILHFHFIFNLLTNVYILLYLFLPSHLITAHQNVIALWALLQSSPPEREGVLYHEPHFELTSLPPRFPPIRWAPG